ncbi:MAG: alpha/beta hydrolase [Acholeplasmataceae bacterium]|nr:alpha/beta hydrolase [Acholeplasmataceae bacterium]
MIHLFEKGTNDKTLLLLHGTGGDEYDLIDVAKFIDPKANILSLRGNVNENGMNRFFKRYSTGVYDYESINLETENLNQFINEAVLKYKLNKDMIVGLGYSNGANLLESLLQLKGKVLKKVILFNPSFLNPKLKFEDLKEVSVFIATSKQDQYTTYYEQLSLHNLMKDSGASIEVFWSNYGHQLTKESIINAKKWYDLI